MGMELKIQRGSTVYEPLVIGDISLTREKDSVSSLDFKVVSDKKKLKLSVGSTITLTSDEIEPKGHTHNLFKGFIFKISPDKDGQTDIVAYDQIRYLKNTDTYVYENKRLDEVLRMICNECQIKAGPDIMNTGYIIPSRIEEQKSYLDMIQSAKQLTIENGGQEFFLWDNFGEIALHNTDFFKMGFEITNKTAEDFETEVNIDEATYNRIKLFRELDGGEREIFIKEDSGTIGQWGLLQFSDTLTDEENGDNKASILLRQKNKRKVSLRIIGALGDARIRGGSMIGVNIDTYSDMGFSTCGNSFNGWVQVKKVVHHFSANHHKMDLEVYGEGGLIDEQ